MHIIIHQFIYTCMWNDVQEIALNLISSCIWFAKKCSNSIPNCMTSVHPIGSIQLLNVPLLYGFSIDFGALRKTCCMTIICADVHKFVTRQPLKIHLKVNYNMKNKVSRVCPTSTIRCSVSSVYIHLKFNGILAFNYSFSPKFVFGTSFCFIFQWSNLHKPNGQRAHRMCAHSQYNQLKHGKYKAPVTMKSIAF